MGKRSQAAILALHLCLWLALSGCGTEEDASGADPTMTPGQAPSCETLEPLVFEPPLTGGEFHCLWCNREWAWTVPADVALAVNPNIYYVRAKKGNEIYILAEKLVEPVLGKDAKILSKFIGTDLEGQAYEMPYKDFPAQQKAVVSGSKVDDELESANYTIVSWDMATEEEGTGIVHIAPGCGPEDYMLGKTERLIAPSPLDERGVYKEGYGWLTGMVIGNRFYLWGRR